MLSVDNILAMHTFSEVEKSNRLLSFWRLVTDRLDKNSASKVDWRSISFDDQLSIELENLEVISHRWENSGLRFFMELYNYKGQPLCALMLTVGYKNTTVEDLSGYGEGTTIENLCLIKSEIKRALDNKASEPSGYYS